MAVRSSEVEREPQRQRTDGHRQDDPVSLEAFDLLRKGLTEEGNPGEHRFQQLGAQCRVVVQDEAEDDDAGRQYREKREEAVVRQQSRVLEHSVFAVAQPD